VNLGRRSIPRDLLALSILCGLTYFVGLTTHGLTNWQEAQRAAVARDMDTRGEWLVPTINGQPYLSKPPMFYWVQLGLNRVVGRGSPPSELELRLTVALAGWLGVICTYLVGRRLLADDEPDAWAEHAAWWASLMLATGMLYVRSSRIGEIDILLVPATVVGIGAIARAWRRHRLLNAWSVGSIALATAAATFATMTKGPPGLLSILLGGYGGITLYHLFTRGQKGRVRAVARALWRTQPIVVLGVPMLVLWGWSRLVAEQVGADVVAAVTREELSDNLHLFVSDAWSKNLGTALYGVGLGSIAAVIALIWLAKHRPRLRPGWVIVLAWCGLSLAANSVLGKGVGRYMTPLWPGVALLGGMWLAADIRDLRIGRWLGRVMLALVLVLAIGQSWWYGFGRERYFGQRCPRAFVAELLESDKDVDQARVGTFEFYTPAVEYSIGRPVQPIGNVRIREGMVGRESWTIEQLTNNLAKADEPMTILIREHQRPDMDPRSPIDRLAEAGLVVHEIPMSSRFVIDSGRTEVHAVRVEPGGAGRPRE
jgi:4-amino-4-deoxy-L-arabinose transferase-like glycosyltransferase